MKFFPSAVKTEIRLARFLKKLNFTTNSLQVVKFISKSMISLKCTKAGEKQAQHKLRDMKMSIFHFPALHMLRYIEMQKSTQKFPST